MERKVVGRFYGIRFDELIYGFEVYSDGKIKCPNVSDKEFSKIVLKPRFMLLDDEKGTRYYGNNTESNADHSRIDGLVREYVIDPILFAYMVKGNMIEYSVDMAEYYGFDPYYAYDKKFTGKPFKWASKKGKVLVKQKQGVFN